MNNQLSFLLCAISNVSFVLAWIMQSRRIKLSFRTMKILYLLLLTISVISYYVSYAFITDDTVLIRQRSLMILDTCRYIFCLIVGAYWIINNWKKDSYYRFRLIPNQYEIVTLLDVSNLGMLDDQINPYGNDFIKTEKDIYISLAETPLRSKHYVDLVVESNDKVNNVYTCKDLKIIDNKIGRERFAFVFSIILSIWVMILSVLLGYLATHIALPYTRAEIVLVNQ